MLNKKWYPSQSPAMPVQKTPREFGVAYYKHIKNTPIHGGRIVAKVIGRTKEEAELIARHICDMHNDFIFSSSQTR